MAIKNSVNIFGRRKIKKISFRILKYIIFYKVYCSIIKYDNLPKGNVIMYVKGLLVFHIRHGADHIYILSCSHYKNKYYVHHSTKKRMLTLIQMFILNTNLMN